MTAEILLLYVPACFALNMAPGPNNLLSVSNASRFGFAPACRAGIGRIVAFAIMIAIAASGLAVILHTAAFAFTAIKIAGAIYLFVLAWQLWNAPVFFAPQGLSAQTLPIHNLWRMIRQEFWIAAGNPKAILIFTAFLPQFVNTQQPVAFQFFVLGLLFLLLEWVAIGAYAYMGAYLGKWFAQPGRKRLFNRVCAFLLGGAGLGLLAAVRE